MLAQVTSHPDILLSQFSTFMLGFIWCIFILLLFYSFPYRHDAVYLWATLTVLGFTGAASYLWYCVNTNASHYSSWAELFKHCCEQTAFVGFLGMIYSRYYSLRSRRFYVMFVFACLLFPVSVYMCLSLSIHWVIVNCLMRIVIAVDILLLLSPLAYKGVPGTRIWVITCCFVVINIVGYIYKIIDMNTYVSVFMSVDIGAFLLSAPIMTIMYHLSIYTRQNRQQLEQKRAEAASLIAEREQLLLRQNARLEEEVCLRTAELIAANKTKDRLFSIISHDFRSPIATLKGSLNLLQRDILSPADFVKLTQNLASSTDRLYNNLDTMLQWALSQLGEITTRPTIVNAHELADEAIDIMQDAANRKGISLLNSVKCDMLIKADEYQLITIFRNLLDNAIKFTPVKGRVEVGGYPDATWGLVFVRDTGVGTAPTTIGELLNSGISTVGTAGEKGLGLGLRLCNELLSKNGGYLSIHSELGAGTTIECRLPLGIMSSSIDAL